MVFLDTLIYGLIQKKYDDLRPYMGKIRSLTVSVFHRISSYTVADIYDRNTITCLMAKYGGVRSVYGMYIRSYTRPYTIVDDRLPSP